MRVSVTPQHDLPDWIQRARQGIDWGSLLVLVLCLMASSSFILQPGLPLTVEGESLLFRTSDTVASFQEGRLYPRWSPHALHGYGAPIPHYTPPAIPWISAAISFVANTDPANAIRVLWTVAFVTAGLALYTLVMRRTHAIAGFVAAALYLFSPYIGLTLPHVSGNLSEMFGLSLTLVHLWAINRLIEQNGPWDAVAVVLSGAALILTSPLHAGMALLLSLPILILRSSPERTSQRLSQAWGLSLLMSAFYWLPAMLEQFSVRWIESPSPLSRDTLTLSALLRPSSLFDPAELLPVSLLGLGTPLIAGALISIIVVWHMQKRLFAQQVLQSQMRRWRISSHPLAFQLLYLTLGLIGIGWLAVQQESPSWLVGTLTLCLSIGSTAFLEMKELLSPPRQRALVAITTFLLMLSTIPLLFPSRPSLIVTATPETQIQYEQQRIGVASAAPSSPIPTTLTDSLLRSDSFVTGYETRATNRFSIDPRDQGRASVVLEAPEMYIFQVRLPERRVITTQIAAFDGWTAWLDNTPLQVQTDRETGLLQIVMPPSEGQTLTILLDSTPPRLLGWGLSASGVLLLALWIGWQLRREKSGHYRTLTYLSPSEARLLAFVLGTTLAVILVGYQGIDGFSLRPQGWYGIRDSVFLRSRSNELELLAYHIESATYHGGDTVPVTLYWQAIRSLEASYVVELSVRDVSSGRVLITTDAHAPAFYTTRRWIRGMYMRDDTLVVLPPDVPSGRYVIAIKVYPCERQCRPSEALNFFDDSDQLAGTLLTLPQVLEIRP